MVQNGTIYDGTKDAIVQQLADAIEKYPSIEKLIIPGEDLPNARQMIRTKGNYLFETNRKFVAELQKGV